MITIHPKGHNYEDWRDSRNNLNIDYGHIYKSSGQALQRRGLERDLGAQLALHINIHIVCMRISIHMFNIILV